MSDTLFDPGPPVCSVCGGREWIWDKNGEKKKCPECQKDKQIEVDRVREEAIERADRPPSGEWKAHAHRVIERTALAMRLLTSEDVWDHGLQPPDAGSEDGDALGPAMRRARTAGFIEPTGQTTTRTNRPQRHNNPKRIWRSLIYEERDGTDR